MTAMSPKYGPIDMNHTHKKEYITDQGCEECDRLKAELAAAREKIAFYEKPCPEAERWPGPWIVPDYMRLYQVERWRNKELNAELAKLRALCAARPKPPSDAYVEDGVSWESYYSYQEEWESRVDAAGRGEGEK